MLLPKAAETKRASKTTDNHIPCRNICLGRRGLCKSRTRRPLPALFHAGLHVQHTPGNRLSSPHCLDLARRDTMSASPRPSTSRCLSLNVNGLDPYDLFNIQQRADDNATEWRAFGRAQGQRFPRQGFSLKNATHDIPTTKYLNSQELHPSADTGLQTHRSRVPTTPTPAQMSIATNGIAILIKDSSSITSPHRFPFADPDGRLLRVDFDLHDERYCVINVYAPCQG